MGLELPGHDSSWYRDFRTDLDTSARQVTVVLPDTRSAKGLAARLNKDVKSWGRLGDFGDASVKAFKKTTTKAVNKLH